MVRPTIRRKNLFQSYMVRARKLTREWTSRYRGIEAVMLTGGVSRGYADEMSELDLTLFLDPATFRLWIDRCPGAAPGGRQPHRPVVHRSRVCRDRRGTEGSLVAPQGLGSILRPRAVRSPRSTCCPPAGESAWGAGPWSLHEDAVEADWYWELALEWINRTDVVAGHHLLNRSFDHFLSLLFRAQGELVPFDKWTFHLSRSLDILPANYIRDVRGWLAVRAFTRSDIERRTRHAKRMLKWWKTTFPEAWFGSRTRAAIEDLREKPMDLDTFDRRVGARALLAYPLRAVTAVERRHREWIVRLDEKRLDNVLREGVAEMLPYQLDRLRLAVTPRRHPSKR